MNYGFIYCLGSSAMPGIFKIGMTERAPAQRNLELSSATSAAVPFSLLCFGQVYDPRTTEAEIHMAFAAERVSANREFFRVDFAKVCEAIREYSDAFAMTDDGEQECIRQGLIQSFQVANGLEAKIEALLSAAQYEGVKFWKDGDNVRFKGRLNRSGWIFGAALAMKEALLEVLPAEIVEPVAPVVAEEIDW